MLKLFLLATYLAFAAHEQLLFSQQREENKAVQPSLYEFILVKVRPGMRQDFMSFLEKEFIPLYRENRYQKSVKTFLEDAGGEWDLIVVFEYADYSAFGKSKDKHNELLARKIPDEKERAEFIRKFQGYIDSHRHLFYREVPELSK